MSVQGRRNVVCVVWAAVGVLLVWRGLPYTGFREVPEIVGLRGSNSWIAVAAFAVVLSGCELEVLNPGAIQDEDLTDPDLMPILVNGVSAEFNDFYDDVAFDVAILADEMAGNQQLATVQSASLTTACRRRIVGDDPLNIGMVHCLWHGTMRWLAHRRRRQRGQPVTGLRPSAAARVAQLADEANVVRVNSAGKCLEVGDDFVVAYLQLTKGRR